VIRLRQATVLWVAAAAFVATIAAIAWRAETWIAPGPRFDAGEDALVLDGERLVGCLPAEGNRSGPLHGGGVRLYANVDLTFRAVTRQPGAALFVVARGRPLEGEWPLLTAHVDRVYRGGFFVDSAEWRLYRLDLDLAEGEHHVRLSYVNDQSRYPVSRDADLKIVGLGDVPAPLARQYEEAESDFARAGAAEPLVLSDTARVVVADRFDLDSGSEFVDGAKTLWSSGWLGRRVVAPEAATWRVVLRARGDTCAGAGPRVLLVADAEQVVAWEITGSPTAEDYSADLYLEAGEHEVMLAYLNDFHVPGVCDRNLHVAWMRFEPTASPDGEETR
jgi:hypothetical protein